MDDQTKQLAFEALTENIQWIMGGIVAAMTIRITDATDDLLVIGFVTFVALAFGTGVNFIAKANLHSFRERAIDND